MTNSTVTQDTLSYLEHHQVMTLATFGPQGLWAAAVFYVNKGFRLFFISAAHTRHARNMKANSQVSATIQEDYRDWKAIQGVQLEGLVMEIKGETRKEAEGLYLRKYSFIKKAPLKIQTAFQTITWYELTPTRVYFIDNSKGFGHRDELLLPE